MSRLLATLVAVVFLSACSNECHDYCETFVNKAKDCGLGGPSSDSDIDECGDQIDDVLTDDACSNADENIKTMSCENFKATVCAQSSASSTYNCN